MENQTNTPDSQKPKVENTFKTSIIVGVALIIIGIVLIVVAFTTSTFILVIIGVCLVVPGMATIGIPATLRAAGKVAKSMHDEINKQPAKFCKHCGAPVEPNQKFCSNCGNTL